MSANVLGIVTRELEAEHILDSVSRHERRDLAAAIRRGEFDGKLPGLAVDIEKEVRAKLAVAHPGYAASM